MTEEIPYNPYRKHRAEKIANAMGGTLKDERTRLRDAAPQLLEACKAVASSYASGQAYDKSALPLVLEAIAAAEGKK